MKFALQASRVTGIEELRRDVARAETLGFSAVFLPDHLMGTPLAVGPTLATAAALSPGLSIGALVYGNDFRHPLLLAREAATLQALTGRFICGLGAGWDEREYRAAGLTLDPPGVRIARLKETIDVLKRAWSGEEFSYAGKYHQVEAFTGAPAARPRLMLGGGGRRLIELAAREADMINLNATIGAELDIYTFDRLEQQLAWLGTSPVERTVTVFYGGLEADRLEHFAQQRGFTVEQARESPLYLFGTLDEVRQRIARLERYGITMVVMSQWGCDWERLISAARSAP